MLAEECPALRHPAQLAPVAGGLIALAFLCLPPLAYAQGDSTASSKPVSQHEGGPGSSSNSTGTSEVPEVPGISGLLRGVNAGLTISGVHDIYSGWATVAQPAIGISFRERFSFDITVPIYMYRLAESRSSHPRPNQQLVNQRGEPGDVIFGLHSDFLLPRNIAYQATLSATAPTGDALYGLTSGRPTFDLTNHFEHSLRRLTGNLELGIGDSNTLVNRLVLKDYTSLGALAHFQIGASVPLLRGASFETNAYEQLPIGDQKIYQTVIRRKTTTTVVRGRNVAEDNGFTNALDIPLNAHTTLSAYYSRSLRFHDDVVSVGVTYVLRAPRSNEPGPTDDALLRSIGNNAVPASSSQTSPATAPGSPASSR